MADVPSTSRRRSASSPATASTSRPRAPTSREVLGNVDKQFPGFRSLSSARGDDVPAHINIYVNKQEISIARRHRDAGSTTATKSPSSPRWPAAPAMQPQPRKRIGALTPEQVNRYSRHIIMPQVGSRPVSARSWSRAS